MTRIIIIIREDWRTAELVRLIKRLIRKDENVYIIDDKEALE